MDGARGGSARAAWLRLVKSRWRFGSNPSLSAMPIDDGERGDTSLGLGGLTLRGGCGSLLVAGVVRKARVALQHSVPSRSPLTAKLASSLCLSNWQAGVSQRIFDHYVIKDRLKDGHPQASGDWRVILHGIPCMASRHSLPLVLPAFVRSVPFRLPCWHSLLQGAEN